MGHMERNIRSKHIHLGLQCKKALTQAHCHMFYFRGELQAKPNEAVSCRNISTYSETLIVRKIKTVKVTSSHIFTELCMDI